MSDLLAGPAERVLLRVGVGVALQRHHAADEPRLEVHHAVGVGEIPRQLRVRALDDAGPQAQVARCERDLLRAARLSSTGLRRALPTARRDCRPAAPRGTSRSRRRRTICANTAVAAAPAIAMAIAAAARARRVRLSSLPPRNTAPGDIRPARSIPMSSPALAGDWRRIARTRSPSRRWSPRRCACRRGCRSR